MKFFRIVLALFFLSFTCPVAGNQKPNKLVRVAVVTDASRIKLNIRSPYRILALNTNQELYKAKRLWQDNITPTESGIRIGKLDFKIYGIRIQPSRSPSIYLNGRKFRGAVDIVRQANNKLLAINHLDVDEYIAGVLYHEVSHRWPMEALKAQAIAARTYALYQARVNKEKDYDLVSTAYSQVYGGNTSEKSRTNKAVRLTKNKILTYNGKIFPTFYHATCAGHTENAARLWNIDIAPLRGRECRFCQRSPHATWSRKISLEHIRASLKKNGFKAGLIKGIRILDRDISGRVTDMEVLSSEGNIKLNANRFRLAVGSNLIRSTNFNLEIRKDDVYFEGRGWGHGVGLCQWGTFFMSREKFTAEQILGYYYPESKIENAGKNYEIF